MIKRQTNDDAWRKGTLDSHFRLVAADALGLGAPAALNPDDNAKVQKMAELLSQAYQDGVGMGARIMSGS